MWNLLLTAIIVMMIFALARSVKMLCSIRLSCIVVHRVCLYIPAIAFSLLDLLCFQVIYWRVHQISCLYQIYPPNIICGYFLMGSHVILSIIHVKSYLSKVLGIVIAILIILNKSPNIFYQSVLFICIHSAL